MAQLNNSTKRLQINSANAAIVVTVSVACFLTIFSLVASKTLVGQMAYQNKVIAAKSDARDTLKQNLTARDQLVTQYQAFVSTTTNIIGGSSSGTGDRDGDNAKIVLDALPSKYDYPALGTSLEKLIQQNGLIISSITGTDDEIAQSTATTSTPAPIEMPFQVALEGTSDATAKFFSALQLSIRPFNVQSLTITGNDAKLTTSMTASTYYQPEKNLNIREEIVK
jgi:Tfp pilus assembly protein PilO